MHTVCPNISEPKSEAYSIPCLDETNGYSTGAETSWSGIFPAELPSTSPRPPRVKPVRPGQAASQQSNAQLCSQSEKNPTMPSSTRERLWKATSAVTAITAVQEEGQTRGFERRRRDNLPPPVSRPDHVPSEYSGSPYVGSSGSWYNQNNPPYPSHTSHPSQQQQQYPQYSPYGQYTSSPVQESSLQQPSGYHVPQPPMNSLNSAESWSAQVPNPQSGSQSQAGHQPPYDPNQYQQTPLQNLPPSQVYSPPAGGSNHPQRPQLQTGYGSQPYNQPAQHVSPPPPQLYSSPYHGPGPTALPQSHPRLDHRSSSDAPSGPERCVHGQILDAW